jgi:hypothetical protein
VTALRRASVCLIGFACAISDAAAQTADPLFRSWRWTEEITAPRALALGGAVTGLADDGAAALYNPAGLSTIPRIGEAHLGFRFGSHETFPPQGEISHNAKFSSPSYLVLRPAPWLGLSYHFATLRAKSRTLITDGSSSGALTTTINGPGVGVGIRVSPSVSVGVSVQATQLYIDEGRYESGAGNGGLPELRVRFIDTGDTRLLGTLGVLVRTRELSYGLAVRAGGSWGALRSAINPRTRTVIDEETHIGVGAPWVLSAGVAWRPELQRAKTLLLSTQVDRVFLGGIEAREAVASAFSSGDYGMPNAFEYRAGAELTIPYDRYRFQVRAGWHRQAAGMLVYDGTDPLERTRFPAATPRHFWSLGASAGLSTMIRGSAALRWGSDERLFVIGLAVRYPGLFP